MVMEYSEFENICTYKMYEKPIKTGIFPFCWLYDIPENMKEKKIRVGDFLCEKKKYELTMYGRFKST